MIGFIQYPRHTL
uniref:Uncharacterized protein n=1 Tax=Arundo donax TaxID=35708 RepID=A0A0A9G6W5_ARUDO